MTFEPPRTFIQPIIHQELSATHGANVRMTLGSFSVFGTRAKRKMLMFHRKSGKGNNNKKGGNLVSKHFLRCLWSLLILRLPVFLEKKNFKFFKKKELGIKTLKMMCWVVRYKTNHSFDFSLSGRPWSILPHPEDPFIWWSNAYICLSSHHLLEAGFTFCWRKNNNFFLGVGAHHPHSSKL